MKGHVRKRGSKWCFVIDVYDETGKRKRKWFSGFNTKKEAEMAMAEKINEINKGLYVEPTKEKLGPYMENWLEDKKTQVRPNTFKSYKWLVKSHIIPKLGHLEMLKLKPMHLQRFYNQLQTQEKPLSNRSILHAHLILQEALDRAVKWGIIPRNVAKLVDPPRPQKAEIKVWNEEEARRFLEVAKEDRYYIAFLLAITTGMRKGEILGLRWQDVDLEQGIISVRQTLGRDHSGVRFQEPKSNSGFRTIALPPETVKELIAHRKKQIEEKLKAGPAYQDHGLVVCTSIGTPVLHRNLDRSWFKLLEKAGVPRIRFHDLRHTHATLLLKQGVHPKIVSERLGHSNISITLDTYSHVLPGLQEMAAKQFGEILFGSENKNKNSL